MSNSGDTATLSGGWVTINFNAAVPLDGPVTLPVTTLYVGYGKSWQPDCAADVHIGQGNCCEITTVWLSSTRKKTWGVPPGLLLQATVALKKTLVFVRMG